MPTLKDNTKNLVNKLNKCSDKKCSTGLFTYKQQSSAINICKKKQSEWQECMNKHIPDFKKKVPKKLVCEKEKCKAENEALNRAFQNIFTSEKENKPKPKTLKKKPVQTKNKLFCH